MALSDVKVRSAKPEAKAYKLTDGEGMVLLVHPIRDNPAKDVYEDEFFSIRYYQKGTAHLVFKRLELIERMNDIIAKHFPGMLGQ